MPKLPGLPKLPDPPPVPEGPGDLPQALRGGLKKVKDELRRTKEGLSDLAKEIKE